MKPAGAGRGTPMHEAPKTNDCLRLNDFQGVDQCFTRVHYDCSVRSLLLRCCACHCPLFSFMPFHLMMMSTIAILSILLTIWTRSVVALHHNTTISGENITQKPNLKQGWTPQPDGRGTLDIIYSCGITMILCSWSILCMNVPGRRESQTQILWRKLSLTALGILCPEMIFELALGQWLSARQSIRDLNSSSLGGRSSEDKWYKIRWIENMSTKGTSTGNSCARQRWTMKDAFFTDMGGFILHTRDQLPFPIDAKQLHYLVSKRYLELPELDHRVIEDKNKVDGLLRIITLCQIVWFLINTIGRWTQQLVVTTAELTTVSFILCSLGTAFCWWHKPAGVVVAEIIESDISINDVLQAEGQAIDAWRRTPLDFANRKEWWWSRCWSNFVNILRKMHLTFGSDAKPIDRIADSLQKELPKKPLYTCMTLTIGYFVVLFAGWNYSFPTRTEQLLWRAACVTMMATLFALMIFAQLVGTYPTLRQAFRQCFAPKLFSLNCLESGCGQVNSTRCRHIRERLNNALGSVRNNSVGRDPLLYIPLKFMMPIYVVAFFYCHARTYILVADAIELRSLPASAYATVNWQKGIPHLG